MHKRIRAIVAVPVITAAVLTGAASGASATTAAARPKLEPVTNVIAVTRTTKPAAATLSPTSITLPRAAA